MSSWQIFNQNRIYPNTKNPFFQNFFISFHISIYEFIASEKAIILASNAQVRPPKGNVFLRNAMKKSKSLFGRLQNVGLYLRHPVDAGGAFADVYIENRLTKVHQSRLKFCDLCALSGNKNNCVNQCKSVKSVAENLSIKITKLCKTNPISEKSK